MGTDTGFETFLSDPKLPHKEQEGVLRGLWDALCMARGTTLDPPQVDLVEGTSTVELSWSRPAYYVEVEIHPPGPDGRCLLEWFIVDRTSGKFSGSSEPGHAVPVDRIAEMLSRGAACEKK